MGRYPIDYGVAQNEVNGCSFGRRKARVGKRGNVDFGRLFDGSVSHGVGNIVGTGSRGGLGSRIGRCILARRVYHGLTGFLSTCGSPSGRRRGNT